MGALGPLRSYTVVEVVRADARSFLNLAVGLVGRMSHQFGAKVIKIEPPGGDPVRALPPFIAGAPDGERSALFQFLHIGKDLLTVDCSCSAGRAQLTELLQQADAIITDHNVAHELLDPAVLASKVIVSVTPFGTDTPYQDWPASELTLMAIGGLLDVVGDPEREPLRLGGHQGAYAAGLAAFSGLMAALMGLVRSGQGNHVDIRMVDVLAWVNWKMPLEAIIKGQSSTRQGADAEWQALPCADGYIAVVYQQTDWPALRDMVGIEALYESRFDTRAGRARHRRELNQLLVPWFRARTRREIYQEATARRLPLGPVWTPEDLREDPVYLERRFLQTVLHPALGPITMPRLPVLWNGTAVATQEQLPGDVWREERLGNG